MARSFIALLLVAFAYNSNAQSSPPVIDLGYASYQGSFDSTNNVTNFLGIRYASPPLGNLRFRAPQPPANVSGIQQARTFSPTCLQTSRGGSPTNPFSNKTATSKRQAGGSSEDCLFLNVYFPGSAVPKKGLPTIVWIHGGGYVGGGASSFPGSDLIKGANNGVVVVTIQYRLGLFGFLAGTKVKENGDLNAGLLDQHLALRWVHDHISKFGGDPTQVTIWGQSAGAGSVLQHVIAQDGRTFPPLFRAAITSSTFLPPQYKYNDRIPEAVYNEVVDRTNCGSDSDTLSCLRKANTNALETANTQIAPSAFFGTYLFDPVVDGTFITQRATQALREFKVNGQAYLAITNTNEGVSFVDQSTGPTVNTTVYAGQLFPNFELEQQQEAARLYAGLGTPLDQVNRMMGEAIFICPTYYVLDAFPLRSFKGEFAVPPALHGTDATYIWPSLGTPGFRNADFIKAFSQGFLAFAMSLDPNIKYDRTNILPRWDRYTLGRPEMIFNRTEDGTAPDLHEKSTDSGLLERCRFWQSVGALTGQ
ncbi:hypothetical protein VKT23_007393 [Stygiomarasmius scandens]|uniref:Carboxylic ester hydrolase n=1 Tax=Marasmiellus scandens TaxID=2682957 RepID=A0ABR1JP29_9AGAR